MRTFVVLAFVCTVYMNEASKYSENVNKQMKNPFTMRKVMELWEKAQKHLSGPRLADLYAELTVQDKLERNLKKLKTEDMDKDGLKEAEVRQRFMDIVHMYDLDGHYKLDKDNLSNSVHKTGHPEEIRDKKLYKLWKQAEYAGFSETELEQLRQEFGHQQMKIDEYNALKTEMNKVSITENTIDYDPKDTINKDMKTKHREMKAGYQKLEEIARTAGATDLNFKDDRVYQLWALARRANMSKEELDSFKEELKHFEHRIEKHAHLREQRDISEKMLKDEVKHKEEYPRKHRELEEKTQHFERKVEKYHADLKLRVEKALSKHNEL